MTLSIRDLLLVILPIAGTLFGYWLNNVLNRRAEIKLRQYELMIPRYEKILSSLSGFYDTTNPSARQQKLGQFLKEYEAAFLFAPDEVVDLLNDFLKVMSIQNFDQQAGKETLRKLILAMRRSLGYRKTKLKLEDFQIIGGIGTLKRKPPEELNCLKQLL